MSDTHKPAGAIFDAAIQLPEDQRAAYLELACAGDAVLRQRVAALLRALEGAGEFMDRPALGPMPETIALSLPISEKPGDNIGRYKLLQQIGEGGCGVVYMAEQQEPVRRRVALKVIKLGMDTRQVIARFEAERQALALMDHPNIAKVLDAGATETGRPYFVMELVHGIKTTDYCDQNNLSTRGRLDLFIQICQAIQHAHQKGIIHRDIKPSNILVTLRDGVPMPKVIDFGIAKATQGRLTDQTLFTAFEQFLGTPAYMSPEQALMTNLDIDTRSDIYSLGVLLYELLTGKTPFEARRLMEAGLDEIRRIIREEEPVRPSARLHTLDAAEQTTVARHRQSDPPKLVHLIRGDLDWIVMKALEKDRGRRYETANGLAMDVQRHLAEEPVVACPPSRLYRLQKMVRRNKLAVSSAMGVSATLVIGLGLSTWLWLQEREANRRVVAAEGEHARLLRPGPADEEKASTEIRKSQRAATLARVRSNWLLNAQQGRIKEATGDLATAMEMDPEDHQSWWTLAPLLVESGDLPGYRKHREAMLARFGATSDQPTAAKAAEASLLLPVEGVDLDTASRLADLAVNPGQDAPWGALTKGLAEYRRGRFTNAIEWEQKVLAIQELDSAVEVTARSVVAMAQHQISPSDEGRAALRKAGEIAQARSWKSNPSHILEGDWANVLIATIVLSEAKALIEGQSPAASEHPEPDLQTERKP